LQDKKQMPSSTTDTRDSELVSQSKKTLGIASLSKEIASLDQKHVDLLKKIESVTKSSAQTRADLEAQLKNIDSRLSGICKRLDIIES